MARLRRFEVSHGRYVPKWIGKLLSDEDTSDIILRVEEEAVPAHRVILAASSEYFRALLYGNMKESKEVEIVLKDIPLGPFKLLMNYIYTGNLKAIGEDNIDTVLGLLEIVHLYGYEELEAEICGYLTISLTVQNAGVVLQAALSQNLKELKDSCFKFIDDHASTIMGMELFLQLPEVALEEILSRDTFCAKEVEIFKAAHQWIANQPEGSRTSKILEKIRFPLIALTDLLEIVRVSGLLDPDRLLDVIREKSENGTIDTEWRGYVEMEKNVATMDRGMEVLQGRPQTLANLIQRDLLGLSFPEEITWLKHTIGDPFGIVISLGKPFIINKISVCLHYSSSYYVEVSLDKTNWHRVVDHSEHTCHSAQQLYFEPQPVRYVRFTGTGVSTDEPKVFKLDSFNAFYTRKPLKLRQGFPEPEENIASPQMGARIQGHRGSIEDAFVLGTSRIDSTRKVFCKRMNDGPLVVELTQPFFVDNMRILLWDGVERRYSYTVSVSADNDNWTSVAFFLEVPNYDWQYIKFKPSVVVSIKIERTLHDDSDFRGCADIECPAVGFGQ